MAKAEPDHQAHVRESELVRLGLLLIATDSGCRDHIYPLLLKTRQQVVLEAAYRLAQDFVECVEPKQREQLLKDLVRRAAELATGIKLDMARQMLKQGGVDLRADGVWESHVRKPQR